MTEAREFDVLVLGGGSGLTAAYYAERDGKSVALVESQPHALGGTCVNRGCIPTKGLVQSAEVMKTIRDAERFGIELDQSSVRVHFRKILSAVRERRRESAESVKSWVDGALTPFYGRARFVGERTVEMEDGTRVQGKKVFVATGARPAIPPITGIEEVGYWTNETVLEQDEQPESLVILGGGYIGCEFGHFFSALGTKVSVIERDHCLLNEDDDVREVFTSEFGKKVELLNGAIAKKALRRNGRRGFVVEDDQGTREVLADAVLVATGRRPNTDGLELDRAGVETDERGWIRVGDGLRTTHPDVYAYGDVIGQGMFKHTSSYEGEIAYKNSQGADLRVSYRANPHAVFSDPQIGAVGLTERECRERELRYEVAKKDYAGFAKGKIIGSPVGFAKLLVEKETDRILGFHMVGPQAADLIHEVVVAMNAGEGTADLVRRSIHVHPTLPELIRQVFDER